MSTPVEIAVRAVGTAAAGRAISGVDSKTSRLGSTLRNVAKAGALAFGAAAVYAGKKLVDMTQAAIEDEAAQAKLAQTLRNTAGATDRQVAGVEKWITKQGRLLGITDDELRPALQRMAEGTGSVTKAQRMVALAMDVSAGTGKSLKAVTEALLRAQNGSVGGLSRYGIATKDARGETLSLSKVIEGMSDKFKGQAAVQANTLAGKMDRLKLVLSEAGEAIGAKVIPLLSKLVPDLTDAAVTVSRKVIPAFGDMVDWLGRNSDEIRDTATSVKDGLLPPLKTLGGVVADVARFFSDLSPSTQSFAFQAGATALVVGRMNRAFAATNLTGFISNVQTAETRTAALGRAARTAAGIGGVLALTQASRETNKALSATESVLGGVAIGFAMGGPIGALVGGLGGVAKATWDLTDPTDALAAAQRELGKTYSGVETKAANYADTLDQVTGAVSRQTRAEALASAQRSDVLPILNRIGVAGRDVVGTVLGQEGATRRLNRALQANLGQLSGLEQLRVNEWLGINTRAFAQQQDQVRDNARDLASWKKVLRGLPPKVQTAVKQIGADASAGEIRKLKRQYDLTPKQVRTIIAAVGTETTIRKVRGVWQVFEDGERVRGNLNPWQRDITAALANGRRTADRGVRDIGTLLSGGTAKARANVAPFNASLSSGISTGRGRASSGGSEVGAALASGFASGIGANAWQAVNAAAAMVADAVAAARRRADAHSPSRVTHRLGADMGEGLARGMASKDARAKSAGSAAVRKLIEGFDQGTTGITKVVDRLSTLITTTFAARMRRARRRIENAKAERQALHALEQQETRRARSLRKLDDALVSNGKAQDKLNGKLQSAREKLRGIVQESKDYATSIRDAMVATADVTTLGRDEAGTATIGGILDQMRSRVQAAQRYADLIKTLTDAGLNKTSLRQLLAAGVEGGLSTAEALAAGGSAAVNEINTLTGQLEKAGKGLGNRAADTMYGAGIAAAEGIIKGLERREKRLDRVARRLANTLANAVRDALKIHSPSRVFEDLGKRTVEGLRIGLDDTHVRRDGRKLAASLVDGFADPKLTARAVLDATTAAGGSGAPILVELSAQQLSDIEQGRRIQLKIDAFAAAGGRRRP